MTEGIEGEMEDSSIRKKGGPRTTKGKAVSKLNAISHGITSFSVPPSEQTAFKVHRQSITDSYHPANAVEEFLCDRIAMLMWRSRRLDAWEASRLEASRQMAVERTVYGTGNDLSSAIFDSDGRNLAVIPVEMLNLEDIRHEVERVTADRPEYYMNHLDELEEMGRRDIAEGLALEKLPEPLTLEGCTALPGDTIQVLGIRLSKALIEKRGVSPEAVAKAVYGRKVNRDEIDGIADFDIEWTPEQMAALWKLVDNESKRGDRESAHLVKFKIALEKRANGQRQIALAQRATLLINRAEQGAIVLGEAEHGKLQRYDTGLERSLFKAMHELEALQEKRAGGMAPLARVEFHGNDTP